MIRKLATGCALASALVLTGCAPQSQNTAPVPISVTPGMPTFAAPAAIEVEPKLALGTPLPMSFSPVLDPPTFEDLYEIVDPGAGYPADGTGPRYLLAHTRVAGFGSPGNDIISAGLMPGDAIELEGAQYIVDAVGEVPKDAIGELGIWRSADPGGLYIIVCAWNGGAPAVSNLVISAT